MNKSNRFLKETVIVLLAALILAFAVSLRNKSLLKYAFISFAVIIIANTLMKKLVGYLLEIDIKIKFWEMYQFAFRRDAHFKKPMPMLWFPLLVSAATKGILWWFPILEFDVDAKAERVSRRHGIYRFTNVTEWHILWIVIWSLALNLVLSIIGYVAGYELFAKLSVYYVLWSLIPFSSLDGSKVFFRSRAIWAIALIITIAFFGWALPLPIQ